MELVVGYRNGALLDRVWRKNRVLGIGQLVIAVIQGFLAVLIFSIAGAGNFFGWFFVLFGLVHLVLAGLALTGRLVPRYAKVMAPNGIAWVLRPDGVLVGQ